MRDALRTPPSVGRDDPFVGRSLTPALEMLRHKSWSREQMLMVLHLVEGAEDPTSDGPNPALDVLKESMATGGSFEVQFARIEKALERRIHRLKWVKSKPQTT